MIVKILRLTQWVSFRTLEYFWSLSFLWQKLCPLSVSLACSEQASHYHYRIFLSLSPPYTQSNGFFHKNRAIVLIHNANRQIRNVPYDDRKVNDLCRSFLISYILMTHSVFMENSCIVWTDLSLLCASVVTLHLMRMIFKFMILIDTSDSCHCCNSSMRFDENLNSDPIVKFTL